jgi:4-amino-4-deoxy-L-arabinose transferase-like glycosyltransferase
LIILATLPHPILIVLPICGLIGVAGRRRWVVIAPALLFIILYTFYTFFLIHYCIAAVPAVALLAVLGLRALKDSAPSAWRMRSGLVLATIVCMGCLAVLPESHGWTPDLAPSRLMAMVHGKLAHISGKAVVLFRFSEAHNSKYEEPVYNADTAWPDDERIIRAHDLGDAQNHQLYAYYAADPSDCRCYLYDEGNSRHPLMYLGRAADLAAMKSPPTSQPVDTAYSVGDKLMQHPVRRKRPKKSSPAI